MLYDNLRCSLSVSVVLGRPAWREGEEGDWRTARYRVANYITVSVHPATRDHTRTHLGHSLDGLSILDERSDSIPWLARQQEQQPPSKEPCPLTAQYPYGSSHPAPVLHEDGGEELSRARMEHERVGEATECFTLVREERILLLLLQLCIVSLILIFYGGGVDDREGGDAGEPPKAEEGAYASVTS